MSPKQPALIVELKKLQIVARLSEETVCFVADVYVGGKKVGTAENDGHGGNTNVQIRDAAVVEAMRAHALEVLPEEFKSYKHLNPVEWLIDDLVFKAQDAKENARVAKRVAKVDLQFKTSCAARGTHAARFTLTHAAGKDTQWIEYRGDEATARAAAEKKYAIKGKTFGEWTVVA